MRRLFVLGAVLAVGALSMVVSGQAPAAPSKEAMATARIEKVKDKPVTRIINTHTHGDHTGGNGFFGASVESIVHENARTSMMKMPEFSGANAQFLPRRTYKDKLSVGSGKDQIDLYHFGRGHTNRHDAEREQTREPSGQRSNRPSGPAPIWTTLVMK